MSLNQGINYISIPLLHLDLFFWKWHKFSFHTQYAPTLFIQWLYQKKGNKNTSIKLYQFLIILCPNELKIMHITVDSDSFFVFTKESSHSCLYPLTTVPSYLRTLMLYFLFSPQILKHPNKPKNRYQKWTISTNA